jgi:ZIP family zinc transporter
MLLPLGVTIAGGWMAMRRRPGPRLTSALQHFAAGIVIAAVCTEVVPDAVDSGRVWSVLIGFTIGVAIVMGIRVWSGEGAQRSGRQPESKRSGNAGLIATTAADFLIDGLLVGLGFTLAASSGKLLVIAVTFEVLFISMTIAATMRGRGVSPCRVLLIVVGLGGLLMLGGVGGAWVLVDASQSVIVMLAAFGTAAMLYLVVEELLVEAHTSGETTFGSTMFFVGFGGSMILSMVLPGSQ